MLSIRPLAIGATVLAAGVALAACSSEEAATNVDKATSAAASAGAAATSAAGEAASNAGAAASSIAGATNPDAQAVTSEDIQGAIDAALAVAPGTVIDIDYDTWGPSWDVDVLGADNNVQQVEVRDGQGAVRETERGETEDAAGANAQVTITQAIDAALGNTRGVFESASFDNGVWEVSVHDGQREVEIAVDPTTADILSAGVER